jgi:hypothetical protein
MGAVGGLLGTSGGAAGTGFSEAKGADLQTIFTPEQIAQQNALSQNTMQGQAKLLTALQQQGGLQQQTNAQNANTNLAGTAQQQAQQLGSQLANAGGIGNQMGAMSQQQRLNNQLSGAGGVQAQTQAIAGLGNVANRYGDIAEGRGPNPAQAMLNQQTGQNVANQAALMAGQRGAGANVGLLARQAAQQGANTQQQAVGQGAVMQANQQLNALQGMQGANSAMGGLGAGLVGQNQTGIGSQAAIAQNQVGNQLAQQNQGFQQQLAANQAVTGQANQMAGQQLAQTNANVAAAQGQQNMGIGAVNALNQANVASQASVNAANTQLANTTLGGQQDMIGGIMQSAGVGGAAAAAAGGYVAMADGGMPYPAPDGNGPMMPAPTPAPVAGPAPVTAAPAPGPSSSFASFLAGKMNTGDYASSLAAPAPVAEYKPETAAIASPGDSKLKKGSANIGALAMKAAPALLAGGGSPERDLTDGGHVTARVPSEKAVKPGNSYGNDKIKAVLSEHEIVLPRTVTLSKDPVKSAADFVAKVIAKRKVKK